MPLQERRPGLVELACIVTEWEIDCLGGWELPGFAEHPWSGMDLHRCFQQQILDCRMQIPAHYQAGLGSYERDIAGRSVMHHVTDPGG